MSSKKSPAADSIKAKAQQLSNPETTTNDDTPPRAKEAPQVRAKRIRRTVDLPVAHHQALDTWCSETARELGRARVTGQDVLRTLVAELLRDETTARKIRKALREDQ